MAEDPLVLRFDPQTVEHLGAKMYSHLPNAVAELVANAYDADATHVSVIIGQDTSVCVVDDGHGMSRDDLASKYLRIGRNRRNDTASVTTESGNRFVSGKKGLGKLALFGIGRTVELETKRAGSPTASRVLLSYDEMMSAEGVYSPSEESVDAPLDRHGTSVKLKDLKRRSPIEPGELAVSLSRLFNYTDTDFKLDVVGPTGTVFEVTPELRLDSVAQEFSWSFPEDFAESEDYLRKRGVRGRIVSAQKPLNQGWRGVTLYAHGRLVNEPEFFGASESSFAFQYLTGFMEVDFIDETSQDIIATDRRALDWESDEVSDLRLELQQLLIRVSQAWRDKRREARATATRTALGTDTETWVSSVKSPEMAPLKDLVETITSEDLDIAPEQQAGLLEDVRRLAPDNAEFAWRHLHPEIQLATKAYYNAEDYWSAVQEAIKRYLTLTSAKSGISADNAMNVVTGAFGAAGKLKVLDRLRTDPSFTETTLRDIQEGQKHLSMGVLAGFRNPMSHAELERLRDTDAMTYQDCLDALSIVSHLMRRLDESTVTQGS